jgi:ketosteroid isomerase-like protein
MTTLRATARDRDHADILELTHRYCWALDDRDWDALRRVFTDDADADLGVQCADVDAIVDQCRSFLSTLDASHHMVTNHLIDVDGDVATCRCYFQAQHVVVGLDGGESWMLGGRYIDRLRRTDDGWRVEHRDLVSSWSDGNPAILARALR